MSNALQWPADLQRVTLSTGDTTLELAPEMGGAIAAYYSERDGVRFNWLRPATSEVLQTRKMVGMASYPLLDGADALRFLRALLTREQG